MNAHEAYFSEMLSLYTDGQLNETEQQVLFAELAQNSTLREELTHTLLIRNTLRADKPSVPAQLRASVLDKAGIAPVPASSTASTGGIHWLGGIKKVGSHTAAFILGILLMVGFNSFLGSSVQPSLHTNATTANTTTTTQTQQEHIQPTTSYPVIASRNIARGNRVQLHKSTDNNLPQSVLNVNPARRTPEYEGNTNNIPEQGNSTTTPAGNDNIATHVANLNGAVPQVVQNMSAPMPTSVTQAARVQSSLPFSMEVRGFAAQSFPQFDLPGLINPPVNNFAASVSWIASNTTSLGIELGQETILQEYEIPNNAGGRTIIKQNHLGLWGGVQAQYIISKPEQESFLSVSPAVRGTVGATRMGPMFRMSGGALIGINSRADLALFLESSLFSYQQNSVWHSTTKLGTSLGLCIYF